ncbi:hypothetical protein, partial [Streptomyces montanus]|uniref:hypothetical protein n=1 Tax=Streptomyces montanus TaxID=2580423 RepID=UPI001BB22810
MRPGSDLLEGGRIAAPPSGALDLRAIPDAIPAAGRQPGWRPAGTMTRALIACALRTHRGLAPPAARR